MIASNNAKTRIEWIDYARGIGIILVMIGHCIPYGGYQQMDFFIPYAVVFLPVRNTDEEANAKRLR